jgi:hypothetical protein
LTYLGREPAVAILGFAKIDCRKPTLHEVRALFTFSSLLKNSDQNAIRETIESGAGVS